MTTTTTTTTLQFTMELTDKFTDRLIVYTLTTCGRMAVFLITGLPTSDGTLLLQIQFIIC